MGQEILINVTPQETRVAVLEHGVAQELHIERSSSLGIVGNIYFGKVCRVLPGMQSAFVEIGLQRAAFLHAADIRECHSDEDGQAGRPIQEVLHEGQLIKFLLFCFWNSFELSNHPSKLLSQSRHFKLKIIILDILYLTFNFQHLKFFLLK